MQRGDVYYVDKEPVVGSEQRGGRPAVIVSNDQNNESSDNVTIVYCTSQPKKQLPVHTEVMINCPSTVLCETVTTISKERLGNYVCHLTDDEMERISKCIAIQCGTVYCSREFVADMRYDSLRDDYIRMEAERNVYKELLISKMA